MYRIHLTQKTGFKVLKPEKEVVIRDEKTGLLFYSTEFKTPNVKEFNLPKGNYIVESGFIRPMLFCVDYPLIKLPKKERNRPIPHNFKIVYGKNPNKCSINWDEGKIIKDSAMKDWPRQENDFIYFHELSHAHYQTEGYCDLKAANYMILKGYNPIQIGLSQIDSLSPKQVARKELLVNALIKTYGKYL